MRLSDLSRLRAFDSAGQPLDHVRDVRLERRGDQWVVTAIVVGPGAAAERLGFLHGEVEKPAAIARVMRRLSRHARVVPWEQIASVGDVVRVDARRDDLQRPEGNR